MNKNDKYNVLVFPAGSEIGIEIFNSLKYNIHINLFGATGKRDHSEFIYRPERIVVDNDLYIDRHDFIKKLNEIVKSLEIDIILPTHDSIALFLSEHCDEIKAKVTTSSFKTASVARKKRVMYEELKNLPFCLRTYSDQLNDYPLPLFLKPDEGQGGKGTFFVDSKEYLLAKLKENPDLIICEYLPGEELSVDCFTNKKGELLFIGPRTRERVQMGISFHSSSVALTEEIKVIAEAINKKFNIRGTWFFQVKKDSKGVFKFLEFAVRQASTMGLFRQLGVNFALLSIFDAFDIDVKILNNNMLVSLDRCLFNRFEMDLNYRRVYIDFDDTIIINEKVNTLAIKYLYQCKNNGIKISLITKHEGDLHNSLKQYCINEELFDEIIWLKMDDNKSEYIIDKESIFIDNYYFDREKVKERSGVPVFDVDAIESLSNMRGFCSD